MKVQELIELLLKESLEATVVFRDTTWEQTNDSDISDVGTESFLFSEPAKNIVILRSY